MLLDLYELYSLEQFIVFFYPFTVATAKTIP